MEGMDGWARAGAGIFGADRDGAYTKGAQSAARVETLLAEARIKRDEAMKREQFREKLEATGVDPAQADLLSTTFGAGFNPEQLSGYQGDQQKIGLTGEAAGAARGGDMDTLNNLMTVLNGKPRERTAITGGTAYDAFAGPDQVLRPTPTGAADILASEALAGQRMTSAGANAARAGLYDTQAAAGGYNPNTGRGGSKTLTEAEADTRMEWLLAQARKKTAGGEDPAYIEAWLANEAQKSGITMTDPFANVQSSAMPPLADVLQGGAAAAPASPSGQALAEARAAIAQGADPELVRARLRENGFKNIAERL